MYIKIYAKKMKKNMRQKFFQVIFTIILALIEVCFKENGCALACKHQDWDHDIAAFTRHVNTCHVVVPKILSEYAVVDPSRTLLDLVRWRIPPELTTETFLKRYQQGTPAYDDAVQLREALRSMQEIRRPIISLPLCGDLTNDVISSLVTYAHSGLSEIEKNALANTVTSGNGDTKSYQEIEKAHQILLSSEPHELTLAEVGTGVWQTVAFPVTGIIYLVSGPPANEYDPSEIERQRYVRPFNPRTWSVFANKFRQAARDSHVAWDPGFILAGLRLLTLHKNIPEWPNRNQIDTWLTNKKNALQKEEDKLRAAFKNPGAFIIAIPSSHMDHVTHDPNSAPLHQISLSTLFVRTAAHSLRNIGTSDEE